MTATIKIQPYPKRQIGHDEPKNKSGEPQTVFTRHLCTSNKLSRQLSVYSIPPPVLTFL